MPESHLKCSWGLASVAVLAILGMPRAALAGINAWTELGPGPLAAGERVEHLLVDPDDPAILYAPTRAGLYRSGDGGFSWSLLSSQRLEQVVRSANDPRLFYGHDGVRVRKSVDGGTSWSGPLNPVIEPPAFQLVTGLAVDPSDDEQVIASGIQGRTFVVWPFVDLSSDGGDTWTRIDGPGLVAETLAVDPRDPELVFVGGLGIFRSVDGGMSWDEVLVGELGDGEEIRWVTSLAIAPSDSRVLYAGGLFDEFASHRLWKSIDRGLTWFVPSGQLDHLSIEALAVSHESTDTVYALTAAPGGFGSQVFRSRDGAVTWEPVGEAIEQMTTDLSVHPLFPRTLYVGGAEGRVFKLTQSVADGCAPGEALCLNGDRFHVEAAWRDFQGRRGRGRPVRLTEDSGYLWFFDPDNVELVVKALDGRAFNDHFWVFYGSLSNVGYTVQVTDVAHERVRTYRNPSETFASVGDVTAFPVLDGDAFAPPATRLGALGANGPCAADPAVLCVGDRFELSMSWRDFKGRTGSGMAVALTADSGYFWFFDPENVEVVVKVLDGRPFNGHFWVFFASLSNVEFTLEVKDRESGDSRRYFNPLGTFASVGDVEALP